MAPFPVEVLFGIYLGFLTGIIPALVAFVLGFIFKYFTGVSIPGFGVVVLGVAIAGLNGGLLALTNPDIYATPTLLTATLLVLMLTLYAHDRGDKLGVKLPKRLSLKSLRERTLSADVVELTGGRGRVRVRVVGAIQDMEGYPPLPTDVRTAIREGDWTLPAEGSLVDLEDRFAERLRDEFDLADVQVEFDEEARATVTAAPPLSGLSKRVPTGERAVSVETLVPTGLARGDEVTVRATERDVQGTVVSAGSDDAPPVSASTPAAEADAETDGGTEPSAAALTAPTSTGGEGRVTVSVDRADAETLLRADHPAVVVRARGVRQEFELVSLLRRAGRRFRKVTVRGGGPLDGMTLGDAHVRDTYGIVVLALRRREGWTVAPRGDTTLTGGDELYAVGAYDALDAFEGAVA